VWRISRTKEFGRFHSREEAPRPSLPSTARLQAGVAPIGGRMTKSSSRPGRTLSTEYPQRAALLGSSSPERGMELDFNDPHFPSRWLLFPGRAPSLCRKTGFDHSFHRRRSPATIAPARHAADGPGLLLNRSYCLSPRRRPFRPMGSSILSSETEDVFSISKATL